ncbi:hypothetical protein HYI36_05250 [Bacillus sp. Gen3]|nr:hypothetical protein [Bacillus sp. Gen3]
MGVCRFWWAYLIADKWKLSPRDVKQWDPSEVLEALAYIEMTKPKTKGG